MKKTKQIILATVLVLVVSVAPFVTPNVSAAPPRCYNFNGTKSAPCDTSKGTTFSDDKCYTEVRSGPSGTLTGYSETSCNDPTDRDKDGVGLGDRQNLNADCQDTNITSSNCGIVRYLVTFINILTAVVGLVVVLMIIVGGIQYSAARDNPQAVQAAKGKIINALLGLVAYIFTSAFLQYIVPGGIL